MGSGEGSFATSRAAEFAAFRDWALRGIGLQLKPLAKKNKLICVIRKKGRRQVLNMGQIKTTLVSRFGEQNVRIYRDFFAGLSFERQVELVSDCAVLIR
jgi:hypothetical protein